MSLEIRPGGRLISYEWNSDVGDYDEVDVTEHAPGHLFDQCSLHKDLTLRDVFMLVNQHIEAFSVVLRNWCDKVTEEGLSPSDVEPDGDIDYLELYFWVNSSKKELNGFEFADFHGVSEDGTYWGLSFTKANELAHLPIRLADKVAIYNDEVEEKDWGHPIVEFANPTFTLGQILFGIYWELTFHGSPEKRDEESANLAKIVDNIKEADLSTLEDFDGKRKLQ